MRTVKMDKLIFFMLFVLLLNACYIDGKKTSTRSRSSGSGRGSSRKTNSPQPVPTSFTNVQPSAPKPSLFGWQEKPKTQSHTPQQSRPSNTHSYPSSNTGLSGNNNQLKQPATYQESFQRSNVPTQTHQMNSNSQAGHSYPSSNGQSGISYPSSHGQAGHSYPSSNSQSGVSYPSSHGQAGHSYPSSNSQQAGHSYPSSNGMSGNSGIESGSPSHTAGGYPQSSSSGGYQQRPAQSPAGYPHQQQGGYPQNHGTGLTGAGAAPPPYSGHVNAPGPGYNNYGHYNHPQGPPPPYTNIGPNYGGRGLYNPTYTPQMPGYFGNYGNNGKGFGGVSRTRNVLTGVGIAGAGIGTVLTGLALWNLARSTGRHHHTVIYDNRGQPVAVAPANDSQTVMDSMLADLVNCSLTISNDEKTEVLAIPCAIASSFAPDADVKDVGSNSNTTDNTKCTVAVLTKTGKEYMTTIPCSTLLNSAAENNVTEVPLAENATEFVNPSEYTGNNVTGDISNPVMPSDANVSNQPTALKFTGNTSDSTNLNCTLEVGEVRDPINPCFAVTHNLTVIPLQSTAAPIKED